MRHRLFVSLLVLAAGCGAGPSYESTSAVVSHEATNEISVWVPAEEGPWPVVYMLHGLGGNRNDMEPLGTALAESGYAVFAPTWRAGPEALAELECGYRYVWSIASQHGGDLELPVTFVGHSAGAEAALGGALWEDLLGPGGTYQDCFEGVPRADLVVAIAPCTFEYEGTPSGFDLTGAGNPNLRIVVISGENDPICEPWQQIDTVAMLLEGGYEASLVTIEGANHWTPVFHDVVDGEWLTLPDEPAGRETLRVILDAMSED